MLKTFFKFKSPIFIGFVLIGSFFYFKDEFFLQKTVIFKNIGYHGDISKFFFEISKKNDGYIFFSELAPKICIETSGAGFESDAKRKFIRMRKFFSQGDDSNYFYVYAPADLDEHIIISYKMNYELFFPSNAENINFANNDDTRFIEKALKKGRDIYEKKHRNNSENNCQKFAYISQNNIFYYE